MERAPPCSLRVRLVLLVLSAILPFTFMGVWTGLREYQNARAALEEQLKRTLRSAAGQIDHLFRDGRSFLEVLAYTREIQNEDMAGCFRMLKAYAGRYQYFYNLGVVMPNGDLVCSVVPRNSAVNFADREWFKEIHKSKEFVVSGHIKSTLSGKSVIALLYPVLGEAGDIRMILLAAIDLVWLNQFAAGANLPEGATLNIFDSDLTVLARQPEPEKWIGRKLPDSDRLACLDDSSESLCELTGIDGRLRIYAVARLAEAPKGKIFLSVGIPAEIPQADLRRLLYNVFLMALLGFAAFLAAWFFGETFILKHIRGIAASAKEITKGNLGARIGKPYPRGELGDLIDTFDQMGESLERRERERQEAVDALIEQKKELGALTIKNQSLEEAERKKLARELHDKVGQNLTGLSLNLGIIRNLISSGSPAEVKTQIESARELVSDTMNCVRDVMSELHPPGLSDYGLPVALALFCEKLAARTGMTINAHCGEVVSRPSKEAEIAFFRIAQEALCNAVNHSGASSIDVSCEAEDSRLVVRIKDNGIGFDPAGVRVPRSTGTFGMIGMRERAAGIGANFQVESGPGEGTMVVVGIEF